MRFLILGCGSIGSRHARNLCSLGIQEIVLFDPELQKSADLAREIGGTVADSLERAFAFRPDAALICAPTRLHVRLARMALANGCDLFIEKPVSDCVEDASGLISDARRKKETLLAGHIFRFDPMLGTARKWILEGRIGRVVSARFHFGSYLPDRHRDEDYRVGYGARSELGGGVVLDAIHEIDLACWFFGVPQTVYALGGKFSDLEIDVEDNSEILLAYCDKTVSIHLDFVQIPAQRWCEFIGTEGQLRADFYGRKLWYFSMASRQWSERPANTEIDDLYRLEMRHFLDCLRGDAIPIAGGEEALLSLEIAVAAKESLASGTPIALTSSHAAQIATGAAR